MTDMVDRVPDSRCVVSVKMGDNAGAACESRLQLRCMFDFVVIWLCKGFCDFGKKERERAWRVTRKLGSLVILAESERECLENH